MSNATRKLVVEILGDAKGMTKASKEAEAGIAGLEAKLGKVGSALTGAFAGGAVMAFAKQSIDAAMQDQRAQERLAQTLKNVTQANQAQVAAVEKSIAAMESQFAVADDELRPAFETLVRATKDVGSAQSLLKLALDVSAGSGRSLQDVSVALVKAQNGQMRALKDLGIAVKTTSGDTASFTDVQAQLNAMFGGQAAQAANSQTGQMKKLGIQYENLKESVGTALLPVFMQLASVLNSLLGWWNHLDSTTQGFIARLVVFGGVALGAVKMFTLLRTAVLALSTTTELSLGPIGLLIAGVAALASVLGFGADTASDMTGSTDELNAAVKGLGASADDTGRLLQIMMPTSKLKAAGVSQDIAGFTKVLDSLGLSADEKAQLLANFTSETAKMTDGMGKFSPKAQLASKYLQALVNAAGNTSIEITNTNDSIFKATGTTKSFADVAQAAGNAMKEQQKASDALAKSLDGQRTAALELANAQLAVLGDQRDLTDAQNAYNEALKGHDPVKLQKATEDLAKAYLQLATDAGNAAAEGLGPMASEADKTKAKNEAMLGNLSELAKTLAPGSPLLTNVYEWIAALLKIPAGVMTTIGATIANPKNNFSDILGVAGHAQGGGVGANRPILVGERGPEIFMPGTSGRIIPNGGFGGGGSNITVNVTAPQGQDPYTWGQAIVKALKAFERVNGPVYAAAQ